jgi:hypothetical protein
MQAKRLTRNQAIREMYIQCMGTRDNPGWANLIKNCPSEATCPLYRYRLGTEDTK